ncbi:MAG: ABC transporter permease [Acidimicrobiia bacterium]
MGLALMLILLLDGLWAGITTSITTYEDHVGAQLYVVQSGTRNFFGAISVLPDTTIAQVRADPDVEWAANVRGFFAVIELRDRKVPTFVIGSMPDDHGGPWELRKGRAPATDNEITIGTVIARQHGIDVDDVNDRLDIMGQQFTVVGTTTDAFMASFVFMTHAATDRLLRSPNTTSFVLVGTNRPDAVRARFDGAGLTVLDRPDLARDDLELMARAYEVPLRVMRIVTFAVGSLVIALTAYSAIMERRRDYGMLKAIGAGSRHLLAIAVKQAMIVSAVGLLTAGVLFLAGRALITSARPQFVIVATVGNVGRAAAMAFMMGALAAVVPAARLARLEPATAFRGG